MFCVQLRVLSRNRRGRSCLHDLMHRTIKIRTNRTLQRSITQSLRCLALKSKIPQFDVLSSWRCSVRGESRVNTAGKAAAASSAASSTQGPTLAMGGRLRPLVRHPAGCVLAVADLCSSPCREESRVGSFFGPRAKPKSCEALGSRPRCLFPRSPPHHVAGQQRQAATVVLGLLCLSLEITLKNVSQLSPLLLSLGVGKRSKVDLCVINVVMICHVCSALPALLACAPSVTS